jgi:stearoyl-CoA desaturase (delta-9 desaturase)
MGNAIHRLRQRPCFLLGYFLAQLLVFVALDAWLVAWRGWHTIFQLPHTAAGLWLLPLGLILGVRIPVLMHNCVHGNLRPKILNPILGELAGVYILLGMEAFALNHWMHHAYADTSEDPHNPQGKRFLRFALANNFGGTGPVLRKYLAFHGDTPRNRRRFAAIVALHFLNVPARLAFWALCLGPDWFLPVFAPSYAFHLFVFAHINFVTHRTGAGGESLVYDLSEGPYYRFVNFFGHGVYHHHSHHAAPHRLDPRVSVGISAVAPTRPARTASARGGAG